MNIQKKIASVFCVSGLLFAVPAAYSETLSDVTLDDLINSSDVVLDESARTGAAVSLVARPEEVEGGVALKGGQGLKMQNLISAWKANGKVGLSVFMTEAGVGGPPPTGSSDLVTNGEFTTNVADWTAVNAFGGATDFGSEIAAPAGSTDGRFAVVYTGPWRAANGGSLEQTNRLNSSAQGTVSIVYNFVTTEYPKYAGSHFNDNMIVTLSDNTGSIQFGLFEDVNTSTFTPVGNLPAAFVSAGGLPQTGGQTGWITVNSPQLFLNNGNYTVRIEVNDVTDAIMDSAILVDRIGVVIQ